MILSPIGNNQVYNVDGTLVVGGKIHTYVDGTTTLAVTYGDKSGITIQTNPIILNQYGMPDQPIWIQEGRTYKFIFMDEDDNLLWTYDGISGINDFTVSGGDGEEEGEEEENSEWIQGDTGVYQSSSSFYINGDKSLIYHKFRRIKLQMIVNFVYGFISNVVYNSELDRTEIEVVLDNDGVITEFLSNTFYSILSYAPQAYPNFLPMAQWQKKGDTLQIIAGRVNAWEHSGNFSHVTGTGDIVDLGTALQEGGSKYLIFDDIGVVIINNEKIHTPQGVNLQLIQGDIVEVFAGESGVTLVTHLMSNKASEVATWDSPLQTRQTVLTGPYTVQNPSLSTAPYWELPTKALVSMSDSGWVVTAGGVYPGHDPNGTYNMFNKDVNPGAAMEFYNNGWVTLEFPEIYYIDKVTVYSRWYNASDVKNMDYAHVYLSLDGINFTLVLNSWHTDTNTYATASITQQRAKYARVLGWNTAQGQFALNEIYYYGYRESQITVPTVSTSVESLIKKTNYIQISPTMGSAAQGGVTVSASSEKGTGSAWKAFDGSITSYWESTGAVNEWLKMAFPEGKIINRIRMSSATSLPNEMPERWVIQGSNDNTAWTDIKEYIDTEIWTTSEIFYFDFANETAYLFYRIFIKTAQGGASVMIGDVSFQQLPPDATYGSVDLNLSESQTVITIADGFTTRGQSDFTIALPLINASCPIAKSAFNYIYLRRNPSSGQISYESKQFSPIYGRYQPQYIPDIPILLRGNNTESINSIIDSYGNTPTVVGTITVSTIDKKFGAGSLLFSSAGSYLRFARNMGMTRDKWTMDCWWNPQSLAGSQVTLFSGSSYTFLLRYLVASAKLNLYISSNGSTWDIASNILGLKANFAINTWYYIKLVFTGKRYLVFVNGVQDIEVASSVIINQVSYVDVGAYNAGADTATGYIDDFRFRPGVSDFYSDLTPIVPTETATYIKPWYFNITQMKGYEVEEDGTHTSAQLVCLGEAYVRDGTSYNAVPITYAYNGRKNIQWSEFNPVVDDWIVLPHNIGTDLIIPSINLNSKTATSPFSNQAVIPIEAVGMYGGSATWGGIPMGKTIDRLNIKIRYPASSSADYVAAYGGSGALASISGDAISVSGTFMRAF